MQQRAQPEMYPAYPSQPGPYPSQPYQPGPVPAAAPAAYVAGGQHYSQGPVASQPKYTAAPQSSQHAAVAPPPYAPPPFAPGMAGPSAPPPPFEKDEPFGGAANAEREPMLLLDITGSMNAGTSAQDDTPRLETVRDAVAVIVKTLETQDSQAGKEDDDDEGGLRTVTFSDGKAEDIGDLNSDNLKKKWDDILFEGRTWIMPGWKKLLSVYNEEFGGRPPSQRPILMALVITDGEALDTAEFAMALAQAPANVFIVLAIVGFGADHDAAIQAYRRIAGQTRRLRVVEFGSESDYKKIANSLLQLIRIHTD